MSAATYIILYLIGTVIFSICLFPIVNKWFKRDRVNPFIGFIKREDDVTFTMIFLGSLISGLLLILYHFIFEK